MIEEYQYMLEKEISEADRLLKQIERESKRFPEGRLEICKWKEKYVRHYVVTNENGKEVHTYIRKKRMKQAEQLAQKSYDKRLKEVLQRRKKAMEVFLQTLAECNPIAVYERESSERKRLITPLVQTDEQIIERWYEETRPSQNVYPMSTSYSTIRGENVRSKSEKIIADTYHLAGIPYVYEPAILLSNGKRRCPDFAVLNVRLHKTMYHEHFGMMDDDEYRQNAILKIREYNRNGYTAGERMIYTFEGENCPFSQDELDRLIRDLLR